jgi:hypothetical protein
MGEPQPMFGRPSDVSPEAFAFLTLAMDYARGIRVLAASSAPVIATMLFLRGWTLEFALKSYLTHKSVAGETLKKDGHDLEKLWRRAVEKGLPVDPQPPAYCKNHKDMLYRYRQGMAGTNAGPFSGTIVIGGRPGIAEELQVIVDAVGAEVAGEHYSHYRSQGL